MDAVFGHTLTGFFIRLSCIGTIIGFALSLGGCAAESPVDMTENEPTAFELKDGTLAFIDAAVQDMEPHLDTEGRLREDKESQRAMVVWMHYRLPADSAIATDLTVNVFAERMPIEDAMREAITENRVQYEFPDP